jgi:signal recognition particle GTPase
MVFGWVKRLKKGLSKSSDKISTGINTIIKGKKIDENVVDEFEELVNILGSGCKVFRRGCQKIKIKKTY